MESGENATVPVARSGRGVEACGEAAAAVRAPVDQVDEANVAEGVAGDGQPGAVGAEAHGGDRDAGLQCRADASVGACVDQQEVAAVIPQRQCPPFPVDVDGGDGVAGSGHHGRHVRGAQERGEEVAARRR